MVCSWFSAIEGKRKDRTLCVAQRNVFMSEVYHGVCRLSVQVQAEFGLRRLTPRLVSEWETPTELLRC